jgi:hypothetical protein
VQVRSLKDFDPRIPQLIKTKAAKLASAPGFTRSDAPDIEQDLSVHVFIGLRRHDPARGNKYTLADRIISSKSITIFHHRTAGKRDRRRERGITSGFLALAREGDRPLCNVDCSLDVAEAIRSLPSELRFVAEQLMQANFAEVSRRTGLSPQQLRRARREIAAHFSEIGLAPEGDRVSRTMSRRDAVSNKRGNLRP